MNLGGPEMLILLVIAVVVFGGAWLPKAARNLGRAKVEVDKAQQQFNETKTQVVEATGLDKAEAALKKANRTLNQSPKNIVKNAALSSGAAAKAASSDGADAGSISDAEVVRRTPASNDPGPDGDKSDGATSDGGSEDTSPAAADRDSTVNVDFSD